MFAQQVDNEISGIALELLGKGKELAAKLETEVTAVLIGYNVKGLADKLAEYGADKVILVDDPNWRLTEPSLMHMHWHLLLRNISLRSFW